MGENRVPIPLEAFTKGVLGTGTFRKILLFLDGSLFSLCPSPCIGIAVKGCGTCGVPGSADFDTVGDTAVLVAALFDGSHGCLPVP
jgi:hypothetical protein